MVLPRMLKNLAFLVFLVLPNVTFKCRIRVTMRTSYAWVVLNLNPERKILVFNKKEVRFMTFIRQKFALNKYITSIRHVCNFSIAICGCLKCSFSSLETLGFYVYLLKVTPMQIWKSANIFVFTWKYVPEFTLKGLLYIEICAREICEKFVYKHSDTIE